VISKLFSSSTLGRLLGFALVVIFIGLLASPYVGQSAGSDPDGAGSPTPVPATPAEQAPPGARVVPVEDVFVGGGLSVAFEARPAGDPGGLSEVRFRLVDATTGLPATPSTPPAVWISRQQAPPGSPAADAPSCQDRIRSYVQGTFDARPEIDLTSYFVMVLNDDASISVIDPVNGVTGISQLFEMVLLAGRGEDWVMTGDGSRLFVSMPEAGQVAVVDTDDFEVVKNVDVAGRPVRMALQPDGRFLWVANDSTNGAPGGVTVIDVAALEIVARLGTGGGEHEIAFSGDVADLHGHPGETGGGAAGATTYAFIANRQEGTVSVVDARRLELEATVKVGAPITGIAYSGASGAVYVAGGDAGGLTVIDASSHEIVGRVATSPGIGSVRFAPGGRWGFAVRPADDSIDVIDATTNRIVHTVKVPGAPDRVGFSATQAYVHASEKAEVTLIDLAQVGRPEAPGPVKVSGGEMAPGRSPVQLSVADPIVPVHEHGGQVLIANPGDKSIYYYMEGMNAPMGAFTTYGRTPRAVAVVDRSIRETAPGVYEAKVKVPGSGRYQVAFQLDSPRVVHCFSFTAEDDPSSAGAQGRDTLALRLLSTEREVKAGESFALSVAVVDPRTNEPVAGIADLQVLATLASGQQSERVVAVPTGPGTYQARLELATPGSYQVYFAIPSRQVGAGDQPPVTLQVTPSVPQEDATPSPPG